MKISKGTDYALHSLLYLISNGDNQPVTVKKLSDVLNVSVTYLSKILIRVFFTAVPIGYVPSDNTLSAVQRK